MFIFYYLVVFTTVFFRITSCITFTKLAFAALIVFAAKSGITMFANVLIRITICITFFIFDFLVKSTKDNLAVSYSKAPQSFCIGVKLFNGGLGGELCNKNGIIFAFLTL